MMLCEWEFGLFMLKIIHTRVRTRFSHNRHNMHWRLFPYFYFMDIFCRLKPDIFSLTASASKSLIFLLSFFYFKGWQNRFLAKVSAYSYLIPSIVVYMYLPSSQKRLLRFLLSLYLFFPNCWCFLINMHKCNM